jgi:hypothetical protein
MAVKVFIKRKIKDGKLNEAGFAAFLDGPTEFETFNLGLQP